MGDLLWPGDERAGDLFSDAAVLSAMVRVEQAWLDGLAGAGLAPATTLSVPSLDEVASTSEAGGNPVIPLVKALRRQSPDVHRGLTSQDVLDTALVLCLDETVARVRDGLRAHARSLAGLVRAHRATPMVGRTLTQFAVPITFGLKAASWLHGVTAAAERLRRCPRLPAQLGGAAGTLAAVVELSGSTEAAKSLVSETAARLGLAAAAPWHTERSILTEYADALVGCADAWGRIAGDVALLSRPEIAELREGSGGGSSTMPGKANPVLSVLVRRHALAAPPLASTLHLAASSYVDERPDGGWHAEWDTLRTLARRSVTASSQAADLLAGLVVDADEMRSRAAAADETLRAEQRSMGGGEPPYLGLTEGLIDDALARAARLWGDL